MKKGNKILKTIAILKHAGLAHGLQLKKIAAWNNSTQTLQNYVKYQV